MKPDEVHVFPRHLNGTACPKCNIPYSITTFAHQVRLAYPSATPGEVLPINCSECGYVAAWLYQGEWDRSTSGPTQPPPSQTSLGQLQIQPIYVIVTRDRELTRTDQVAIIQTFVGSGRLKPPASDARFGSINVSHTPTTEVELRFLQLVIQGLTPMFPELEPYFKFSETSSTLRFEKKPGIDMQIFHVSFKSRQDAGLDMPLHLLYIYPASSGGSRVWGETSASRLEDLPLAIELSGTVEIEQEL